MHQQTLISLPILETSAGNLTESCMFKIISAIILAFMSVVCVAQTNKAPAITNWGVTVCGAQLSIALSSDIIVRDTNVTLKCWITNSSINVVGTPWWNSSQNFYAVLTNSERIYALTPNPDTDKTFFVSRWSRFIQPLETDSYEILLPFAANLKPGNYKLFVKRRIVVDSKGYDLLSNVLQIHVE
jgi:hypothetical protein